MNTNTDHGPIVIAARVEAQRMRQAAAEQDDGATVRMSAAQFRTLALLIERLADGCATDKASSADRSEDEAPPAFRTWVPLRHFTAARKAADESRAETLAVRSQLQEREADYVRLTSLAFGLQPAGASDRRPPY